MKRIIALALAVIMVMCLFAGCAAKTVQPEVAVPEKEAAPATENGTAITVTDLDGKTYTFDKPLDKVIIQWSGSGGPFMTMAALYGDEVCDHIAGMDEGLQKNRKDMYEQYLKTIPQLADVTNVGNVDNDDFNLEAAIASGADAAIIPLNARSAFGESIQPKLEAAGIPVIYMDYHAETMENHIHTTEMMGTLFGKEERAEELVAFYKSHMDKLNERVAELLKTNERPNVYVECGSKGGLDYGNSYANNSMWGGMIYTVGGNSIADGAIEKSSPLEAEYVISSNPDTIIITGSYWNDAPNSVRMGFQTTEENARSLVSAMLERPGWSELDAVKNGKIYIVHHALGRELYDCASVEALAQDIWPGQFDDLDPTATLKEYYDRFLPFDFGGLWYMHY